MGRIGVGTLAGLLRIRTARIGLIGAVFVFLAQFAAYTYVSPYLEDLVKVSAGTITVALLVFGLTGIAGNFLAGATLARSIRATVGVAMGTVAVTVVLLPFVAGSLVAVFVLLALWGLVWGALPLSMQTWMSTAAPAAAEGGLALFVTTIQLSIAAGSVIGGAAVGAGGLAFDFWLAGGIAVVGAILLPVLGRRPARERMPVAQAEPTAV